MRKFCEKQGKKLGLAGLALAAYVEQSIAAVPAGVTTAMADMQADAVTVATAFLVAIIAVKAFKLMRRGA